MAELDAFERLEVGLLRGKRMRLTMAERRPGREAAPLPDAWIVTGGARGITAEVLRLLATEAKAIVREDPVATGIRDEVSHTTSW